MIDEAHEAFTATDLIYCSVIEAMNDFDPDEVTEIAGAAIVERIECIGSNAETAAVGACIGGVFQNTNELKILKFNEAM